MVSRAVRKAAVMHFTYTVNWGPEVVNLNYRIRPILTDVSATWRVVTGDGGRGTVNKNLWAIKEGEHWRIRRNNKIKGIDPVTE